MQIASHLPSRILIQIGLLSVFMHILALLTMMYHSYNFISCIMSGYEWFSGTITMLLLIEHAVWLHLVWSVAIHDRHLHTALILSYAGVLLLTTMWTMELVVPIEPDVSKHHVVYAIIFVFGCILNIFSSLKLLPESPGVSYKRYACLMNMVSVGATLVWFVVWYSRKRFAVDINWHVDVWLENIAFTAYLSSLGMIFIQFLTTCKTELVPQQTCEPNECEILMEDFK
jgi:hypothetical protein